MKNKEYTEDLRGRQDRPKRKRSWSLRPYLAGLLFVAQVVLLVYLFYYFNLFNYMVYTLFQIGSVIYVLNLISKDTNPTFKLAWSILILTLPIMGLVFYSLWGRGKYSRRVKKNLPMITEISITPTEASERAYKNLKENYPAQAKVSAFLSKAGFPLYEHTDTKYYSLGDLMFPEMIEECKKAKEFIYMEYFIIAKGQCWSEMLEVLKAKSKEGVDVRILYDDFGCITTLPRGFTWQMKRYGIKAAAFNPVVPAIDNFFMNYRSHHKICIIDGNVGFTGGTNLADEYVNLVDAFGHWKDAGVRLKGSAVTSLTVFFTQMWNYAIATQKRKTKDRVDLSALTFSKRADIKTMGAGFVQPFCDGPLNNPRNPAEHTYMHIINNATEYVYMTTPYLVLDNEMITSLCLAARSGVDVRIITPGVPDKKTVYMVTRSYYGTLLKNNVKIYEYLPGFIHAKTVVSDDIQGIVGTINMDYRSFYLHFEDAVWMCGTASVLDLRDDFMKTLKKCKRIDLRKWQKRPRRIKIRECILRVFAPLL